MGVKLITTEELSIFFLYLIRAYFPHLPWFFQQLWKRLLKAMPKLTQDCLTTIRNIRIVPQTNKVISIGFSIHVLLHPETIGYM